VREWPPVRYRPVPPLAEACCTRIARASYALRAGSLALGAVVTSLSPARPLLHAQGRSWSLVLARGHLGGTKCADHSRMSGSAWAEPLSAAHAHDLPVDAADRPPKSEHLHDLLRLGSDQFVGIGVRTERQLLVVQSSPDEPRFILDLLEQSDGLGSRLVTHGQHVVLADKAITVPPQRAAQVVPDAPSRSLQGTDLSPHTSDLDTSPDEVDPITSALWRVAWAPLRPPLAALMGLMFREPIGPSCRFPLAQVRQLVHRGAVGRRPPAGDRRGSSRDRRGRVPAARAGVPRTSHGEAGRLAAPQVVRQGTRQRQTRRP
jgi:hypothetical protein